MIRALIDQDWVTVLKNEQVWDLLDEPDIQEHLNAIEEDEVEEEESDSLDDIRTYYLNNKSSD
jgi:hypothetical protein